jgi:hypothetical protein
MRCRQSQMSIGELWVSQRKIELSPIYQREAGVWSLEKKQLFIDSLLNGFDVPKLYFNELPPGEPFDFAVVDGKQRVSTILDFIRGEFSLAEDFIYSGQGLDQADQPSSSYSYQNFTETAREKFKGVSLVVTMVYNATEEDIEALFARLNNGEPLNSAESRNAIGGDMAALIRDVSNRDFFSRKVKFSNSRYSHREVACKLLYMEWNRIRTGLTTCPDLKKKYLDQFVKDNRDIDIRFKNQLTIEIDKRLKELEKCFDDNSPELTKQSYPQFFFLWLREILNTYTHAQLYALIRSFLPEFTLLRLQNNEQPEEDRDPTLVEFGRLTQQGTNDSGSMTKRAEIMTRYFLTKHPEVQFKDPQRAYSEEARYVIWLRAEKKCQNCSIRLPRLEDMDADHVQRHVDGGATTLENARCLCQNCNRGQAA